MPVYEYLCNDCGPFTEMRPMSEFEAPQDCPHCEAPAPRAILTAPAFFCMPSDKRKAHATNERSRHAPKTLDQYKASHGPGCGCCSGTTFAFSKKWEGEMNFELWIWPSLSLKR